MIIVIMQVNTHSIYNLRYNISKYIPIVIHNGSNYHWHLIIKELAK